MMMRIWEVLEMSHSPGLKAYRNCFFFLLPVPVRANGHRDMGNNTKKETIILWWWMMCYASSSEKAGEGSERRGIRGSRGEAMTDIRETQNLPELRHLW